MSKRRIITNTILVIIAITGLFLYLFLGNVSTKAGRDSIIINSTFTEEKIINYSDIDEIFLYDSFSKGIPSVFFKNVKINTGWYSSTEYGAYQLITYNNVKKYIILNTNDQYLIFNCESEQETKDLFDTIKNKLNGTSGNTPSEILPEENPAPTEEPSINIEESFN